MTYVRQETYKAITENNLDDVVFQDPFSDVTRKTKRNLLVVSFVCLLISILKLQVTGFLGLQASTGTIGNDLAQGLACTVVVFLLVSFIFHAFIDYSAWQFQRERLLTKPYLDLIGMIENHIQVTTEQVKNAVQPLNQVSFEREMQAEIERSKVVRDTQGQLDSIDKRLASIANEITPLLISWRNTINGMERLRLRLKARFVSLWILDILLPLALSGLAIGKSYSGVQPLLLKLWS